MVERMKMLSIVRSSLKEHSKPSWTSIWSLALDQESYFSIALEDDEDFSMRPADELSLEDLELTLDNNDDFHRDFDMYFDFFNYQLESSPNVIMAAVEKDENNKWRRLECRWFIILTFFVLYLHGKSHLWTIYGEILYNSHLFALSISKWLFGFIVLFSLKLYTVKWLNPIWVILDTSLHFW